MNEEVTSKLSSFFEKYPLRSYKKGQILIHAGDDPGYILSMAEGKVKQYDLTDKGEEIVVNSFKPPAFFPLSVAINHTPNEYFFEAETNVKLRKAPSNDVTVFLQENPDVLYDLLARVYRGVDGLMRRTAYLMAGTARSRVLHELIIECRRFGNADNGRYDIGLNESGIAARAGLSRETVNREISKLKAEGLISISGRQITVMNLERLETTLSDELQ